MRVSTCGHPGSSGRTGCRPRRGAGRPAGSWLAVLAILFSAVGSLRAADDGRPPKLDEAVDRGLAYLAKQQRADGWFDDDGRTAEAKGKGGTAAGHRREVTGLCVLAFLSAGHTPDVGRHGVTVRRAIDALVAAVPEDGDVGRPDADPAHARAVVALALSQAYGVEPSREKRLKQHAALTRVVTAVLAAQDAANDGPAAGGWRAARGADHGDLTLSAWNALALRAARDVGMKVPDAALKRAADFVAGRFVAGRREISDEPDGVVTAGATGVSALCLYLLDPDVKPAAAASVAAVAGLAAAADAGSDAALGRRPYEAMYHVAQAAAHTGDDAWRAAVPLTIGRMMREQESDGGWPRTGPAGGREPGRVYRAAVATLTLTVPYRVLPAYQR